MKALWLLKGQLCVVCVTCSKVVIHLYIYFIEETNNYQQSFEKKVFRNDTCIAEFETRNSQQMQMPFQSVKVQCHHQQPKFISALLALNKLTNRLR